MRTRKKPTLMPLVALAALSVMVAVPVLSSTRLYAASTQQYTTITVKAGQTLWSIAADRTGDSGDIQETIDRITAENHLQNATLQPGEHLKIPQ